MKLFKIECAWVDEARKCDEFIKIVVTAQDQDTDDLEEETFSVVVPECFDPESHENSAANIILKLNALISWIQNKRD